MDARDMPPRWGWGMVLRVAVSIKMAPRWEWLFGRGFIKVARRVRAG